jgi:formate dehydrogenase major subunit
MSKKISLKINGRDVTGTKGETILEVCERNGIDVPTLCHFPGLSERGACRMCLVEVKNARGLLPACVTEAADGMEVETENERLAALRRSNLELLFAERNHLCMFCEMSGDCELQALAYRYGMDHVRYSFGWPKLGVDTSREYFFLDQNRCILCRRCVRACEERAGHATLGVRDRGPETMICADMDFPFDRSTCVSCGTCLQVCPTGALVDKKSAYVGRGEELKRVKTVCTFCSVGCAVEILSKDGIPVRVESSWEEEPTRGVLCARGRFEPFYDTRQRIREPHVRRNGDLVPVKWKEAERVFAEKIRQIGGLEACTGLLSSRATNETAKAFRRLFGERSYLLETSGAEEGNRFLSEIDQADCIVVAGIDFDEDCPAVSSFVKRAANRGVSVIVMGSAGERTDRRASRVLAEDDYIEMRACLEKAFHPVLLYGPGAGPQLLASACDAVAGLTQVGLARGTNTRGIEQEGFLGWEGAPIEGPVYLLLTDEPPSTELEKAVEKSEFLVVQASFESSVTERADVVFPSPAWSERSGTYINTEGRIRRLVAAVDPPGATEPDEDALAWIRRLQG